MSWHHGKSLAPVISDHVDNLRHICRWRRSLMASVALIKWEKQPRTEWQQSPLRRTSHIFRFNWILPLMSSLLTPLWYCITNYRDGRTAGRTEHFKTHCNIWSCRCCPWSGRSSELGRSTKVDRWPELIHPQFHIHLPISQWWCRTISHAGRACGALKLSVACGWSMCLKFAVQRVKNDTISQLLQISMSRVISAEMRLHK